MAAVPFLVAALLFYAAIAAVALNVHRRKLYVLGIPFTAGQIAIWYVAGMPTFTLGAFDKTVQVMLIIALVYLFKNERWLTSPAESN